MHRLIIGPVVLVLIHLAALGVRADRLDAVWICPNGLGGEGDWNVAANWNLAVVPNNGADGNGDGMPDIFDVRIDSLPTSMSIVHGVASPIEVAGLTLDAGDSFDLSQSSELTLRDSDSNVDLVNDGLVLVVGGPVLRLAFAGEGLRLSGGGTMQLGMAPRSRGVLMAIDRGRVTNGVNHTIRTTGVMTRGQITFGSLTNEGAIVVEDHGELDVELSPSIHHNFGTIEAKTVGRAAISAEIVGTLHNRGVISATDEFSQVSLEDVRFFNEADGIVRASNRGTVRFRPPAEVSGITNRGMIEATDHGVVRIEGQNIVNQERGAIQAKSGGTIWLTEGTFRPDPAIRLVDSDSTLLIHNAVFENEGNVLQPPGPGILQLSAHIRGGEITNGGIGRLVINGGTLEDVTLRGQATGEGMGLKGNIRFPSQFSFNYPFAPIDGLNLYTFLGDATLTGPGVSRFGRTFITTNQYALHNAAGHQSEFGDLLIFGNLVNDGIVLAGGTTFQEGALSGTGVFVSNLIGLFNGSTLAPGDGLGTMSVFGRVWFGFRSSYLVELGSTESDLLNITGNLLVDRMETNLVLSGGILGESYVITRYTGEREGTFTNVTPGYNVIYDDAAMQIRVEVIPEPESVLLAVSAIVVSGMMWRFRTRRGAAGACVPTRSVGTRWFNRGLGPGG